MQLLHSRAVPGAEFASLSLIHKGDIAGDQRTCRMGEPLLLPTALSSISYSACVEAVKELHRYVNSAVRAKKSGKDSQSSKLATALFQEDESLLNDAQVFRPGVGQGIGLHYRLIRDRATISAVVPLVFNASKVPSTASKTVENDVTGVIICVGIAGLPSSVVMSSLHHSLSQRMKDCMEIISKGGAIDVNASKTLLTTMLLMENEDRLTNTMSEAANRLLPTETDDGTLDWGGLNILGGKKKSQESVVAENDLDNELIINSADQARIMVERLAVLSVAENDTIFRKFEGRAAERTGKTRRKKAGREADLDGFDFRGEKRSSPRDASSMNSVVSESSSTKTGTSKVQLKQPKKDTASIIGKPRQPSVPALGASSKDTGGRNRRGSDMQRPVRPRRQSGEHVTIWSGDNTNGNAFNPGGQRSARNLHDDGGSVASSKAPGSVASRGSRGGQSNFDPFASNPHSVGDATASTASETTSSSRRTRGAFDDDHDMPQLDSHFGSSGFDDHNMMVESGKSTRSLGNSSDGGSPRVQVNVALNEDLTCFYKLSKMYSCSVEGVVQVQVRSNIDQGVPFFLLIRDPSKHIQSIQENKKFADNMAEAVAKEPPGQRPDYKFTVSVPKADNYFPVMRYKCGSELRPVPIRVQTRVRLEGSFWRVALQISSNPHNEDNLTDLTIIMGVPPLVKGESLTTSPPGGVWNASKRSVIWCVSELGGGEKFQLQARFEVEPDVTVADDEKPKFPVLVRCQCMYAQLSDVAVEVQDIPDAFPADVRMKLARRFRLSHRERP